MQDVVAPSQVPMLSSGVQSCVELRPNKQEMGVSKIHLPACLPAESTCEVQSIPRVRQTAIHIV